MKEVDEASFSRIFSIIFFQFPYQLPAFNSDFLTVFKILSASLSAFPAARPGRAGGDF